MHALVSIVVAVACVFTATRDLHAQPNVAGRELVGHVRDSSGAAVEGAIVEILGATARTSTLGTFRLWTADIDTLTISIRRLGFSPVSAQIATRGQKWDTVLVELNRLPQRLAAAEVRAANKRLRQGLRDFDERRMRGIGQFVTRSEIVARNTSRTSDVLREARGIHVVRLASGGHGVRFALYAEKLPNCAPALWLDGHLATAMEIDEVPANDVEAIELYSSWSTLPLEFTKSASSLPCGTIVVWTRIPDA